MADGSGGSLFVTVADPYRSAPLPKIPGPALAPVRVAPTEYAPPGTVRVHAIAKIPGDASHVWRLFGRTPKDWYWKRGPLRFGSGTLNKVAGVVVPAVVAAVSGGVAAKALAPALGTAMAKGAASLAVGTAATTLSTGKVSMDTRDLLRAVALPALGDFAPDVFGQGTIGGNLLGALTAEPIPDSGPIRTAGVMQPAAFPMLPALGALGGAVARVGGAAFGVVRSAAGRILSVVLPSGVKITRAKAISLAKTMGVQAAATALGISALEMAEMIVQGEGKRRGKAITAAQLRTTRRTMNAVEKMHRQIAGYCRDAGVRNTRIVRVPAGKRCR